MKGEISGVEASIELKQSESLRYQFAEYLASLPDSKRRTHQWLGLIKAVALGLTVAVLVKALLVSFQPAQVSWLEIVGWWVAIPGCLGLLTTCLGIDCLILEAFPATILPGLPFGGRRLLNGANGGLVTGKPAVTQGWYLVFLLPAALLFWGLVFYVLFWNPELLDVVVRIIAALAVLPFLYTMFKRISRAG